MSSPHTCIVEPSDCDDNELTYFLHDKLRQEDNVTIEENIDGSNIQI